MQEISCKLFDTLPKRAAYIRNKVFVAEQGFCDEFDSDDDLAKHILLSYDGEDVATCRLFCKDGHWIIGRIAVLKEYRGLGLGAALMDFAHSFITESGGRCALVHAQIAARGFYKKCGYIECADADSEQGCPHVWMKRDILYD